MELVLELVLESVSPEERATVKLFVYAMREFDELGFFTDLCHEKGIELGWSTEYVTMDTADLARGYDAISVTPRTLDRPLLTRLHELGVKAISTRSIGVDHIDLQAARDLGMGVSHTVYEPDSVADYAIMLMMMCLRRMPQILDRARVQDYTLRGKLGRNISHMTVGVIGTGRIGGCVVDHLSGFGCKVLAYDIHPKDSVAEKATYVDLDTLLRESDVITLHAPATADNHHMIDAHAFSLMKDDAVLVNTARGALIDTDALIDTLESGKLFNVALDLLEKEDGLYYNNRVGDVIANRQMAILRSFPNVMLTPHTAFYTDIDVRQMAETVVEGAYALLNGQDSYLIVR
jgi:lactate dehydrogenase-like 2-hydroxyacid dehydrogenase